jgi:thiol-disulfide isomerase/thioredoxin
MKRPFLKWLILLILCGTLAFFPHCSKNVKESGLAPDFSLKTLEGQEVTLASLKGKVVLIDFWATWCGPCRESIPHLVDLYKSYREKGFEVVGISVDKGEAEVVRRFSKAMGIPYPILIASEEVTRNYAVTALPTTILVDRKGRIREKVIGFNSNIAKLLTARVKELTSEEP